jgi:hypothetical protein
MVPVETPGEPERQAADQAPGSVAL